MKGILFDADGVIQRPAKGFFRAFTSLLPPERREPERFLAELLASEKPSMTGERDFLDDLVPVLERWGVADRLEDVLEIWTRIEVDSEMLAAVRRLRASGVRCFLATNQQAYRGRHMVATLGYEEVFERCFYSHRLGVAKPDPRYFGTIAGEIRLSPPELLFVDDNDRNVAGAREAGLQAALFAAEFGAGASLLGEILAGHGLALE
ncbi:MAG: HAD family hydrolase [Gemmatimonadales bacterium]